MTNPAPVPGQHVWIEAEVVLSAVGDRMFAPIRTDPTLPSAVRIAPANYRWRPVDVPPPNDELAGAVRNLDAVSNGYRWMRDLRDGLAQRGVSSTQWADVTPNALAEIDRLRAATDVPPQPPVLDSGMRVHLANNPNFGFEVIGIEYGEEDVTVTLNPRWSRLDAPLADVPGPDDSTPTGPPCGHRSGIHDEYCDVINECQPDDSTPEPPPAAIDDVLRLASDLRAYCRRRGDAAPDAIRAAAGWLVDLARERDEALAEIDRLRSAPAAGEGAALIAATEQEIAELIAQEPIVLHWLQEGAWSDVEAFVRRLVRALNGRQAPVQATTHGEANEPHRAAEAVWRVDDDHGREILRITAPDPGTWLPDKVAEIIGSAYDSDCQHRVAVDTDDARGIASALTALANASQPASAEPECKPEPRNLNSADVDSTHLEQVAAETIAERDAARRELEQLRGEVERIASEMDTLDDPTSRGYEIYADELRAAAAATAPATQDEREQQ